MPELAGEIDEARWMLDHLQYMRAKALTDNQPDFAKLCELQPEDTVFGIATGSIGPRGGECLCLGQSSKIIFRPRRLLIVCQDVTDQSDSNWLPGVVLQDVKIGKDSMFKNSDKIDTSHFAATSYEQKIILYDRIVEPMRIVALFLRNDSSKYAVIHSAYVGIGQPSDSYNPPVLPRGALRLPRGYSEN